MKTGSVRSNNNNLNNNKIYADKFEVIENISNNNHNSNPPPSIDLLSYSNNNVYADIVDLDDTETLSLMYSQNVNAQQQFDRGRHDRTLSSSSAKKPYDEQSFYLANSSSRSFDKPYHPHVIQDHRRHYSSSDITYPPPPQQRPHSQNSYYSRQHHSIKDFSNNSSSVQSPLALHSTNNIQTAQVTNNKHSLNKSNSVSSSSAYSSSKMNNSSNKHMANEKHAMPSNARASAERASKNVNSNSKRKIISPEEVIQLFSVPQHAPGFPHQHQHPHLSGFLGRHHNSTTSTSQQQHQPALQHQQGAYLQGASRQRTSSGSSIINEHQRGRKSPSSASSPPTMTHQLYRDRTMMMRDQQHMSHSIPNIHQLATRTIHLKRSDSTKAPNLSLPLNKTSTSHHPHGSNSKSSKEAAAAAPVKEDPNHNGFGICIKGNKTTGRGVLISKVEVGSPAYLAGLRGGDAILEINGTPFTHLHHEEAAKKCTAILKAEKFCSMTIRSPDMGTTMKYNSFDESQLMSHHQQPYPGAHEDELYIPVPHHESAADSGSIHSAPPLKVGCLWIDRHGRSVSPPHEYSHRRVEKMDRVRRIDLLIEPGQSLGLMIRGGIEYGLGIFVTGVDKDSVAERAGLMIGDQILEVNNRSFQEITHDEAVNLLKCHKRMTLLIRDIGKIPYSCSYNNNSYPQSSSSWHAGDTMASRPFNTSLQKAIKKNSGISSIEEKARALLSRNHLLNLIHNISEYGAKRNMDIETFVTILLELLDTPEKHSLVSEIRDIIYPEDRLRFDELMFRHGVTVNLLSNNVATLYGRSGGGFKNRLGIRVNNDQFNHSGLHSGSYFDGIRSITQRLQSWYFGRPLSRQQLRNVPHDPHHHEHHQNHPSSARDHARKQPNDMRSASVHQNSDGNLLVSIPKTKASIGIAIEGGANTKHPLPRIINIHENGAAFDAGGLEVGQLILEVDNHKIEGMQHEEIARLIAESYSKPDRHFITFLVVESKKSNLEPKSTALVYLETVIVIIHFCLNVIFLIL